MFTKTPNFALVTLMILGVSAQHEGLEFSLVRTESPTDDKLCSQVICRVQGMSVFIDDVTISKASVGGVSRKLMTMSTNSLETYIVDTTTKGNGTLKDNSAILFIDFLSCESDFIICEVTYTDGSNQKENAFMIAGLGKHSKFQTALENRIDKNDGVTSTHTKVVSSKASNLYSSELWRLGDKIIKIEDKFETLKDRLDRRLKQNIDTVNRRANTLENSVLGRVSSVETDFSSRFSRLEDRVSSILLSESPDTSSDVAQSLANIERRLQDLTAAVEQVNVSKVDSPDGGHQDVQPVVCERGMGDRVTYPRYVITTDQTIQRQVLCETQTDGGGWTVIQRRAAGDVDFYRDWTAYREGFGSLTGDFWLGNEAIYNLTDTYPYELRIDFRVNGQEMFAEYSTFRIEDESDKYRLRLGSYSGTIGEKNTSFGLSLSNNQQFSTFDRDNDASSGMNCAVSYHGAWWYKSCHNSNLNGIWLEKAWEGVCWHNGSTYLYPEFTELKIRRVRQQIG